LLHRRRGERRLLATQFTKQAVLTISRRAYARGDALTAALQQQLGSEKNLRRPLTPDLFSERITLNKNTKHTSRR
jgi:hypothetical protein